MQDEFYPVAEKILSDLESIIKKDTKLFSFEILPVLTNENKSPIHYEEHCLGLESWCISHVYCHAYQSITRIRQSKNKARDINRLNKLLMGALIINPDVNTLWNMRKELICLGKLDPYFELHFSALVLTRKPKSSDVFSHRKWILKKILSGCNESRALLSNEMRVCEVAADRYSNNYHAWTHRLWCLTQGIPFYSTNLLRIYQEELAWSETWMLKHVSDYSGMHYRQQLIVTLNDLLKSNNRENQSPWFSGMDAAFDRLSSSVNSKYLYNYRPTPPSTVVKLIIYELISNSDMIRDFVGHEALWYHRRSVFNLLKKYLLPDDASESIKPWGFSDFPAHLSSDGVPLEKNKKLVDSNAKRLGHWVSVFEGVFLGKCCSDQTDSRTIMYVDRHKQWLKKHLNFQLPYNVDNFS